MCTYTHICTYIHIHPENTILTYTTGHTATGHTTTGHTTTGHTTTLTVVYHRSHYNSHCGIPQVTLSIQKNYFSHVNTKLNTNSRRLCKGGKPIRRPPVKLPKKDAEDQDAYTSQQDPSNKDSTWDAETDAHHGSQQHEAGRTKSGARHTRSSPKPRISFMEDNNENVGALERVHSGGSSSTKHGAGDGRRFTESSASRRHNNGTSSSGRRDHESGGNGEGNLAARRPSRGDYRSVSAEPLTTPDE